MLAVLHRFSLFTALGTGVLGGGTAFAATFTVNDGGDVFDGVCDLAHCSLRDAAWQSNLSPGSDIIVIAPSVPVITLSLGCAGTPEDDNACGDIDFWDVEPGASVAIVSLSIPTATLMHGWTGLDLERLLHVPPASEGRFPVHLILEGLYVAGGRQLASTGGAFGGGCIAQEGGMELDVLDAVISDCEREGDPSGSSRGGGAIDANGPTTIQRTDFIQNRSINAPGGALHVTSELYVVDGWVSGNQAVAASCGSCPADGGGIYVDGLASLYLSEIVGNQAFRSGGGVYAVGDEAWFSRVRLRGNAALDGSGGGAFVATDTVELIEVDVGSNDAHDDGGGAFVQVPSLGASSFVVQSSFWENRAGVGAGTGRGGGLAVAQRAAGLSVTVENTTFSTNEAGGSASQGGGVAFLPAASASGGLALHHATLHGNDASNGSEAYNGTLDPLLYEASVFWSTGVDACAGPGAFVSLGESSFNSWHHFGVCSAVGWDGVHFTALGALSYAGGFTKVHPVLSIDSVRQDFVPLSHCLSHDHHGFMRPKSGSQCTVGAKGY